DAVARIYGRPVVFPGIKGPSQFYRGLFDLLRPLVESPPQWGAAVAKSDEDLTVDAPVGHGGGGPHLRPRGGIERFMITDINNPAAGAVSQTEIPVMFDLFSTDVKDFNHVPGGANVLWMDGHVTFEKYPSQNLVSRSFAQGIDNVRP